MNFLRSIWFLLATAYRYRFVGAKRPATSFHLCSVNLSDKMITHNRKTGQKMVHPYYIDPGLTEVEASQLTGLLSSRPHWWFFVASTLVLNFKNGMNVSIPYAQLPVSPGTTSLEMELSGEISDDFVAWLWSILNDCNCSAHSYNRPTIVTGQPSRIVESRWKPVQQISTPEELRIWLKQLPTIQQI